MITLINILLIIVLYWMLNKTNNEEYDTIKKEIIDQSINNELFDLLSTPLTEEELLEMCRDNVQKMKQSHIDLLELAYNGEYDFYLTMGYILNILKIVSMHDDICYRRWSYVFNKHNKINNRTHNSCSIA